MAKYSRDCGAATPNGAPQNSHCDGFVGDALSFFFFGGGAADLKRGVLPARSNALRMAP